MRILGVLFGAFLGLNKRSNPGTKISYPQDIMSPPTVLHESFQEPKLPYSNSEILQEKFFRSFLPLSILLSMFGPKRRSRAEDRVLPTSSISSPANFSFSELRDVIQDGKVFVIKDFIDDNILAGLREDIQVLVDANKFAPSGLSNRAKGRLVIEIGHHCAALCCAVLCCAVLCCAVLCCAVLCCAVLCYTVLCCVMLCCAVL